MTKSAIMIQASHNFVGDLVRCVITEKCDDHLKVKIDNKVVGILPKDQLNDDISLADDDFDGLNINTTLTLVILMIVDNSIILTKRNAFLLSRRSIIHDSHSATVGTQSFGYVKDVTATGSIIAFFGNSIGFLPSTKLNIGDTVYVNVVNQGATPILKLSSNKILEMECIDNIITYMNNSDNQYVLGDTAILKNKEFIENEESFIYSLDSGWKICVLPTYNGIPPYSARICYIDAKNKIFYGIDVSQASSSLPPLTFRGICVEKFDLVSIVRFKQWYCYVRNDNYIEKGMLVYVSLAFNIVNQNISLHTPSCFSGRDFPFFVGLIETRSPLYQESLCDYFVDFLYREWVICTDNNHSEYLMMHKSQLHGAIYKGMHVNGSIKRLNGFSLLINKPELPLFYEDCAPGKDVYGAIIKYDTNGKNHLLSLSPFIEASIKEKMLKHSDFSTYKCRIIKHCNNKVYCSMDAFKIKVSISDYCPGLHYIALKGEKQYLLDVTDCIHDDFTKFDILNEEIDVFVIDDNRVAYTAPEISYTKVSCGQCVSGFVYKVDKRNIYVHIKKDIEGTIPTEYYKDFYTNHEKIIPPKLGLRVNCMIVSDAKDGIVLSSRICDLKSYQTHPMYRAFYYATILHVDEHITAFIETLGIEVSLEKKLFDPIKLEPTCLINDDDVHINSCLIVRNITRKEKYIIISLANSIIYDVCDDSAEENDMYIPLSDSDIEYGDNSQTNDHFRVTQHVKDVIRKRNKYRDDLKQDCNKEIDNLRPVVVRSYASSKNIKANNLPPLIAYLKTHETLHDVDLLSFKTNISSKTLFKWHEKIRKDENWSPLVAHKYVTRKAMDDLLEDSIMYHIYTNFLAHGYQFNDRMCRSIALQFWEQHPLHRLSETFTASSRWLKRFKEKYGLVNRRVHYHRRPNITPQTIKLCKDFYQEMLEVYRVHEENNTLQYLINIDETAWKICNFGDLTWASKGIEHVEFTSDFNEKDMITVIAAISASKECSKLPLCLIRKGKTDKATQIFNEIKQYFQIDVSTNGWSTVTCFAKYLVWLRNELDSRYKGIPGYNTNQEIDLVLDLYASHRNSKVKEIAEKLHFRLHFIPAGFTDSFQPLDRYVFGALKSMARSIFYKEYTANPSQHHTLAHACEILLDCWTNLSEETLKKAWSPYSNPREEEVDSLINRSCFTMEFEGAPLTINSNSSNNQRIIPEEFDSDIELDDDNNIDFDLISSNDAITDDIMQQIKEMISYEGIQAAETGKIVKPIANIWGTCNANTTVQTLSVIPAIKEKFDVMRKSGRFRNDNIMLSIDACISEYYSKKELSDGLTIANCVDLSTDTCENIDHVLHELDYGMHGEDSSIISTIQLTPDDNGEINPCRIIENMVGKCPVNFNKVIALRKEAADHFNYEDIFTYDKYVFILKSVVCNNEGEHFFAYIRNGFSNEFYLANDATIKTASKEQVDESPTVLGLYYIFEKDVGKESKEDDKEAKTTITVKELIIDDRIKEIIESLENEEKSSTKRKKNCIYEERKLISFNKAYNAITPRIRITLGKPSISFAFPEEEIPEKVKSFDAE